MKKLDLSGPKAIKKLWDYYKVWATKNQIGLVFVLIRAINYITITYHLMKFVLIVNHFQQSKAPTSTYLIKLKGGLKSQSMCEKMLGHWRQKEKWLGKEGPSFPIEEIWDGARFKDIGWFWDPNSTWLVPQVCVFCTKYISFDKEVTFGSVIFCPYCDTKQKVNSTVVRGDPRNIGIIGHFDGWQPGFGKTGSYSSGTIYYCSSSLRRHLYCLNKNFSFSFLC